MAAKRLYRIFFTSRDKSYEIYAESVGQGDLYGFIEVSGLRFGERSTVVLDPAKEQLKSEFGSVKRLHLPFHSIQRIDEVEKEGPARILSSSPGREERSAPIPFPPAGKPGR